MVGSDELPFKLLVEQAFTLTGRGTVIVGRFVQGAIRNGDDLELVAHDDSGDVRRTFLRCVYASPLRESDWDPSKPIGLGVLVRGISPDSVVKGSFLQAAEAGHGQPAD